MAEAVGRRVVPEYKPAYKWVELLDKHLEKLAAAACKVPGWCKQVVAECKRAEATEW